MYIPYLYGRQEELRALDDLSSGLAQHGKVVPLIEPTEVQPLLHAKISAARAAGAQVMVVANPTRGDLANPVAAATAIASIGADLADAALIRPVFRESSTEGMPELQQFLLQYPNRPIGVVLTTDATPGADLVNTLGQRDYLVLFAPEVDPAAYAGTIPRSRSVVISNNFPGRTRNIDYALTLDESFGSDLVSWRGDGWAGFSDFTVLPPESFAATGGPAVAVAIHLTYMAGQTMRVRHFVSDAGPRGQNAPKWAVILPQLQAVVTAHPTLFDNTQGLASFITQAGGIYTNLGTSKRQQIGHHVETVTVNMTP